MIRDGEIRDEMEARLRTMVTETRSGSSGGRGPGQVTQGELGQDIDRDVSGEEDEVDRAHTCHAHNAP